MTDDRHPALRDVPERDDMPARPFTDEGLDRLHVALTLDGWASPYGASVRDYVGPDGMIGSGDPEGLRAADRAADEQNRESLRRALDSLNRSGDAVSDEVAAALSDAEHRAVTLAGELWNVIAREVVADGPTREADLQEFGAHVHAIQRAVMAQAAARAYPDRYRLLGSVLPEPG